jgi:hypothetical protein
MVIRKPAEVGIDRPRHGGENCFNFALQTPPLPLRSHVRNRLCVLRQERDVGLQFVRVGEFLQDRFVPGWAQPFHRQQQRPIQNGR